MPSILPVTAVVLDLDKWAEWLKLACNYLSIALCLFPSFPQWLLFWFYQCLFGSALVSIRLQVHFRARNIILAVIMPMWKFWVVDAGYGCCLYFSSLVNVTAEHSYILYNPFHPTVSGHWRSIECLFFYGVFSICADWIKVEPCLYCDSQFSAAERLCFMAPSHAVICVLLPWS